MSYDSAEWLHLKIKRIFNPGNLNHKTMNSVQPNRGPPVISFAL